MKKIALHLLFSLGLCLFFILPNAQGQRIYCKKKGDKYVFLNERGKKVFKQSYTEARSFRGGLAAVKEADKWGFINKEGVLVIPYQFDEVNNFWQSNVVNVVQDGGHYLINKEGEKITAQMDSIYYVGRNFCYQKEERFGFANKEGEVITAAQYEKVDGYYEGEIPVKKDGKWGTWKDGVEDMDDTTLYFYHPEQMPIYGEACLLEAEEEEKQKCSEKEMLKVVYSSVKYPPIARENGVEGVVVIQFVVDKEGQMQTPKIIRDIGAQCGKQALKAVLGLENWVKAGQEGGLPANTVFALPVKFKLH